MTAPLPPYQPARPTWQAGYEHCKRQVDIEMGDLIEGIWEHLPRLTEAQRAAASLVIHAVKVQRKHLSAMRPTPPRYSPGMEPEGMEQAPYSAPTTLHARVAAQDSGSGGNALCGDRRGNEGVGG